MNPRRKARTYAHPGSRRYVSKPVKITQKSKKIKQKPLLYQQQEIPEYSTSKLIEHEEIHKELETDDQQRLNQVTSNNDGKLTTQHVRISSKDIEQIAPTNDVDDLVYSSISLSQYSQFDSISHQTFYGNDEDDLLQAMMDDCSVGPTLLQGESGEQILPTISNGDGTARSSSQQHITIDIDLKAATNSDDNNTQLSTVTTLANSAIQQYQANTDNDQRNDDHTKYVKKTELKSCLANRRSQLLNLTTVCSSFVLAVIGAGLLLIIAALLWYYMSWTIGLPALLLALIVILLTKPGWRWFYIAIATSKRDLTALVAYIRLLLLAKSYEKKNVTIADIFQNNVAKHPEKVAIISETDEWTFRQLNEYSTGVANVFHMHCYHKGDVVGLLLENRPEFVGIWLGLSKIGVVTSLINTNLRGPSLVHSINIAKCSALIYGETFAEYVESIAGEIPSSVALYQINNNSTQQVANKTIKDLNALVEAAAKDKLPKSVESATHHDQLVYIYTSGTTGLPKAAVITHSRYLFIAAGIHFTLGFRHDDVFYTPLPLYHTAGGTMSMGQAIIFGSTVAIRKKFSASGYFADCVKFKATIAQYIGEMARYILSTAESSNDRKHKIRMVFGNGLRPQIWPQFVERFNIPKVGEFYGSTEGNANIMNHDNTVGAIGFVSRILPRVYPISIICADPDTGEPIRNAKGLCRLCKPNEPGVFVGKIVKGNPAREFLGYVDREASAKKIVHDVFKKGDMAFLSGDILIADEKGYLYFKDRIGDTFRWKGENVSTSEVEDHISNALGYKDTIVYGVSIPHTEGQAGMAAIHDTESQVDLEDFSVKLAKVLPTYARPVFLRLLTKIDLTGTFKLRKIDLRREGFNPNIINDPLFYKTIQGNYKPLTKEIYEQICENQIRF